MRNDALAVFLVEQAVTDPALVDSISRVSRGEVDEPAARLFFLALHGHIPDEQRVRIEQAELRDVEALRRHVRQLTLRLQIGAALLHRVAVGHEHRRRGVQRVAQPANADRGHVRHGRARHLLATQAAQRCAGGRGGTHQQVRVVGPRARRGRRAGVTLAERPQVGQREQRDQARAGADDGHLVLRGRQGQCDGGAGDAAAARGLDGVRVIDVARVAPGGLEGGVRHAGDFCRRQRQQVSGRAAEREGGGGGLKGKEKGRGAHRRRRSSRPARCACG